MPFRKASHPRFGTTTKHEGRHPPPGGGGGGGGGEGGMIGADAVVSTRAPTRSRRSPGLHRCRPSWKLRRSSSPDAHPNEHEWSRAVSRPRGDLSECVSSIARRDVDGDPRRATPARTRGTGRRRERRDPRRPWPSASTPSPADSASPRPLISGAGAIGRALLDFAAHHPRVSLELSLSNSVVDLVEEGFDLGFRSGPINDPSPSFGASGRVPSTLAASPGFVRRELRGRRLLTRDAMLRVPAVTTTAGPRRFRRADGTNDDITPNERLRVNDPRVAVDAAKLDLGVIRAMSDALVGTDLVTLTCEIGAVGAARPLCPSSLPAA